ncbi:hypothetical protein [Halosimplex halobium]|uniref:hypothetical protein n=1 Tax=Halosimplex halobium TaxID=3396618 RepID=UPI003F5522E8
MTRDTDLDRFYDLLADLKAAVGGMQYLRDCDGYMDWPERGVYFFFSPEETRAGGQRRLTRIGTHAVSSGSGTSLWDRLRTHRGINSGTFAGGGNHRGSVFRKRVGEAMRERDGLQDVYPEWGEGSSADREIRLKETGLERRVTEYIGDLPFLWLDVNDEPGPESDRAYIERNAIALVSNYRTDPLDRRAGDWLGMHSPAPAIRRAGLWNINHVDEPYDPAFLDLFEERVAETAPL